MRQRIKLVRRNQGMTQTEFAQLLGVTSRTVQHWEIGTGSPRAQTLRRIAAIAGKPVSWFYELEETAA